MANYFNLHHINLCAYTHTHTHVHLSIHKYILCTEKCKKRTWQIQKPKERWIKINYIYKGRLRKFQTLQSIKQIKIKTRAEVRKGWLLLWEIKERILKVKIINETCSTWQTLSCAKNLSPSSIDTDQSLTNKTEQSTHLLTSINN